MCVAPFGWKSRPREQRRAPAKHTRRTHMQSAHGMEGVYRRGETFNLLGRWRRAGACRRDGVRDCPACRRDRGRWATPLGRVRPHATAAAGPRRAARHPPPPGGPGAGVRRGGLTLGGAGGTVRRWTPRGVPPPPGPAVRRRRVQTMSRAPHPPRECITAAPRGGAGRAAARPVSSRRHPPDAPRRRTPPRGDPVPRGGSRDARA